MKTAIVSDIHSNFVSLCSVLEDIRAHSIERIVNLGDSVGYSCLLTQTLALLRSCGIRSIHGNHDLMAIGRLEPTRCGPNAHKAILWTRAVLTQQDMEYLAGLPAHLVVDSQILCLHSCLNDPVAYLRSPEDYFTQYLLVRQAYPDVWICLTGHTHVAGIVEISGNVMCSYQASTFTLAPGHFYFVNPGSVGHPRDGDGRASYAIYDDHTHLVTFRRVVYDHAVVVAENARHGVHTELVRPIKTHIGLTIKQLTKAWRQCP